MGRDTSLRIGAAVGAAGPLIFVAAVVLSSLLQDDYSWRREYISGLSARTADHPWVMVAGFVLAGSSALPFAWSLHRAIAASRGSAAGPVLLAAGGVGLAAIGLFPNDCSDALAACKATLSEGKSWHSVAHDLVSIPTLFCLVVGPLSVAARMLRDSRWRRLGRFTFALFPVIAAVMVVDGLEVSDGWGGVVQRTHVLLVVVWTEAVAFRLFQVSGQAMFDRQAPSPPLGPTR